MPHDLIRGILENNHGSISKAITLIENNQIPPEPFLSNIHQNSCDAIRIGITGPPEYWQKSRRVRRAWTYEAKKTAV